MDKFEMKTNKMLFAVLAVLAVAFVVLAAVPAVIDDSDAGTTEGAGSTTPTYDVVDGVATVQTFDQLKVANADSTVMSISLAKTITVTETFTTSKAIYIPNAGGIMVSGKDVMATFGDITGYGPASYTVDCRNGASLHINGIIQNVQIQGIEDAVGEELKTSICFFDNNKTSNLFVDSEGNVDGVIGGEVVVASTTVSVLSGKTLTASDGFYVWAQSTFDVKGKLVADITNQFGKSTVHVSENGYYQGTYISTDKTEAQIEVTAGQDGFTIADGSIDFSGAVKEVVGNEIIIVSGTAVVSDDYIVPAGMTITVNVGATLTVASGATLTVESDASMTNNGTVTNEGTVANNGSITNTGSFNSTNGDLSGETINYATGSKVVVDGNEYTVYHYTSGSIDIQYGVSCGDVFYTGAVIDEYDVSVLSISLDDKFQMTNKTFTLVPEMEGNNGWNEIRDARTYADALKIQLTFVKDGESGTASNITVNLKTDLVVKPMPVDIRFSFPEKVGDITVSEFMKYEGTENVNDRHFQYFGSVGYYNLNGMKGYYFVIAAEVYDKKGNLMPNAQIIAGEMESKGNGIYMLFLGKTPEEASQKMSEPIEFTANCGANYEASVYNIDLRFETVAPMVINPLFRDSVLGVSTWELYDQSLRIW